MGQITQARIAAWQKASGIEEATGARAEKFEKLSRCAYDLIRVIELERSGIRDGDGLWHGSDALEGTVAAISDCYVTELESSGIPPKVNGAPLEDEIPWDAPVDRLKVAQREIITTFLARHDLVGLTDWIMETAIRGNADPRSAEVTAKALPRILVSDDLTDEIPF